MAAAYQSYDFDGPTFSSIMIQLKFRHRLYADHGLFSGRDWLNLHRK